MRVVARKWSPSSFLFTDCCMESMKDFFAASCEFAVLSATDGLVVSTVSFVWKRIMETFEMKSSFTASLLGSSK